MKLRIIKFLKDFLLFTGLLRLFSPFNNLFLFIRNFNKLKSWVGRNNNNSLLINDYYVYKRDYQKRFELYKAVSAHYQLDQKALVYLEFGVASGHSFFWWVGKNGHPDSRFWGFDTFEGLPEDWGGYKKGDMSHGIEELKGRDPRAAFVKGIFQETLTGFIAEQDAALRNKPKLIHLDADLFSSTLFALSQLYPFLNKGDIILFDEFNVANHEFFAYKIFTEAFYVKLKLIGAQNNFYQTAFIVE
ncbi:MAG TPA: TylF/MycF/NovP-related O-methyltransferase [Puia sp.]|nr:TylF/MycF/NovP-related O-methyltransferase [Puia sp.]